MENQVQEMNKERREEVVVANGPGRDGDKSLIG